ncbi:unnamed protein product [Closterium sp. NIES-54]
MSSLIWNVVWAGLRSHNSLVTYGICGACNGPGQPGSSKVTGGGAPCSAERECDGQKGKRLQQSNAMQCAPPFHPLPLPPCGTTGAKQLRQGKAPLPIHHSKAPVLLEAPVCTSASATLLQQPTSSYLLPLQLPLPLQCATLRSFTGSSPHCQAVQGHRGIVHLFASRHRKQPPLPKTRHRKQPSMSSTESESLSFRDVVFLPSDAAPPYSQDEPDSLHSDSPRSNQRDADVLNDRRGADINEQRWGFLNDRRADFNGSSADFNGSSADFNGSSVDFNGSSADFNGSSVDFNGSSVDFNGSSVDSRAAAIDNLPLQPSESNGASLEPPAMRLPSFSFATAPPVEAPRKPNPPHHERGPESGTQITAATDIIIESSGTSPLDASDYVLVRLDGPDLTFPLHTTPSGVQRKLSRMLAKKRSDGCEVREVASSPYHTSPSPDSASPQSLSLSAVVAADASRAAILPPTYLDLASPRWRVGFSGSRNVLGLAGWRRAADLQVSSPAAGSSQRAAAAAAATAVAAAAAATVAMNSSLGFGLGGCASQPLVAEEEEEEEGEDEEEAREAKGEMMNRALPRGGRADSASPRSPREFSRQNAHKFPPLVALKDAQALVERMMGDAEGRTGGIDGGAEDGKGKIGLWEIVMDGCSGRDSTLSPRPAVIKVVDHLPDVAYADVSVEGKPWEQAELAMKEWTATVAMLMAVVQNDDAVTAASAGAPAAPAGGAEEAGQAEMKSIADAEGPSDVAPPSPSPRIPPLSVTLPLDRPRQRKATSPSQQASSPSQQASSPSERATSPSQRATSPSEEACTLADALNASHLDGHPNPCTGSDLPPAAASAAATPEGIGSGLQDSFYSCRSSLSFSFASDSFNSSIRSSSISSSNNGSSTTAADATTTSTAPPTRAAAAAAAEAAASISLSSILSHLLSNARTLADPSSPPGSLRKSLLLAEMFVAARRSAPVFEAYLAGKPKGHVVASDWSTQLPRHLAEGVLGAFEWVAVGLERAAAAAAVPTRTKISAR